MLTGRAAFDDYLVNYFIGAIKQNSSWDALVNVSVFIKVMSTVLWSKDQLFCWILQATVLNIMTTSGPVQEFIVRKENRVSKWNLSCLEILYNSTKARLIKSLATSD